MAEDKDVKGERGGDTGETKATEKGARAEKGDERREFRRTEGQTRPGGSSRERPGSESGGGSDDK